MNYPVQVREFKGKKYYYVDFGSETHGKPSFRLWINRAIIEKEKEKQKVDDVDYILFPVKDAKIIKTEKGNYVLRPEKGYFTYNLFVTCGYRGKSKIEKITPEPDIDLTYYHYHSERGSLGISEGHLISTKSKEIIYRWSTTGRTYGAPKEGIRRVTADGKEEELEIDDFESLEDLEQFLQ